MLALHGRDTAPSSAWWRRRSRRARRWRCAASRHGATLPLSIVSQPALPSASHRASCDYAVDPGQAWATAADAEDADKVTSAPLHAQASRGLRPLQPARIHASLMVRPARAVDNDRPGKQRGARAFPCPPISRALPKRKRLLFHSQGRPGQDRDHADQAADHRSAICRSPIRPASPCPCLAHRRTIPTPPTTTPPRATWWR